MTAMGRHCRILGRPARWDSPGLSRKAGIRVFNSTQSAPLPSVSPGTVNVIVGSEPAQPAGQLVNRRIVIVFSTRFCQECDKTVARVSLSTKDLSSPAARVGIN